MSAQSELFAIPKAIPEPPPKPRTCAMVSTPTMALGEVDKKGRYWYERFHADFLKLPRADRETFTALVLDTPKVRVDEFRKLLNRYWNAGHVADSFDESMGY